MQFKTLVRPEHLNQHGNLFGGYMLLWVDEFAYLAAIEDYPCVSFVTRAMEAVSFTQSVKLGSVCPRMPDSVFASTPLASAWVAKVCLRSWKRMSGRSAFFRIALSL